MSVISRKNIRRWEFDWAMVKFGLVTIPLQKSFEAWAFHVGPFSAHGRGI